MSRFDAPFLTVDGALFRSRAALLPRKDAELVVAPLEGEAREAGGQYAIQRPRRGTSGPPLRLGGGVVFLGVYLPSSSAVLRDATPMNALNRYVRPLLQALTSLGRTPARYTGRDWVASGPVPVASVGVAHDEATGACAIEAWIGASAPVFVEERNPSFRGSLPGALGVDALRVASRVARAYEAYGMSAAEVGSPPGVDEAAPPASVAFASGACPSGTIRLGREAGGRHHLEGSFGASVGLHASLEDALSDAACDVDRLAEITRSSTGILFGVGPADLARLRSALAP